MASLSSCQRCIDTPVAKGLCSTCYNREWSKGRVRIKCKCLRCNRQRPHAGGGHCQTCYMILRKEKIKTELLRKQRWKCAVNHCTTDVSKYRLKDWCLDHDHKCCPASSYHATCVRGVICKRCNLMFGLVKDSVGHLKGAIKYLLGGK